MTTSSRVVVNVGGKKHEILAEKIKRHPQTRLGMLLASTNLDKIDSLCDGFHFETQEYFFDRSSVYFEVIIDFYRLGTIHLPNGVCVVEFEENLKFWMIEELSLGICCLLKYRQKKADWNEENFKNESYLVVHNIDFGTGYWSHWKQVVWELYEKPTEFYQRIFGWFSLSVVVISIITLCASTINNVNKEFCKIVEKMCFIWFSFEFVCRLVSCPEKRLFVKKFLNVLDFIALIGFYGGLLMEQLGTTGHILEIVRVVRVLRVLRLARHSSSLQIFGKEVQLNIKNLGIYFLFLSIGVVIFATLVFFAENGDNSEHFPDIPAACYWAVITMTTVGYGDKVTKSTIGQVLAVLAGLFGVVVTALPIPFAVNNFGLLEEEKKRKDLFLQCQNDILEPITLAVQHEPGCSGGELLEMT